MFLLATEAVNEIQSNVDEINDKVSKLSEVTDGLLSKLIDLGFDILAAIFIFAIGKIILGLIRKTFVVNDYIVLDGIEGNVEKIDIIYTTLSTIDNKRIRIPNGTVSNSVLTNVTDQQKRRVDIEVGIHYEDNIAKAKAVAASVINGCEYALNDEENVVIVKNFQKAVLF